MNLPKVFSGQLVKDIFFGQAIISGQVVLPDSLFLISFYGEAISTSYVCHIILIQRAKQAESDQGSIVGR